jgi:hypothetical protein
MTDKRLVVKVDSTVKGMDAAYGCYIKPYYSGARGKSFPGAYYSGILPYADSIHCELLGMVLAIEHANTFAHITKIDTKNTILQVRNDCQIAVNSLCNLLEQDDCVGLIATRFKKAIKKWTNVEIAKVSRSDLKTVHLLSRSTNSQMIKISKEWHNVR